MRRTFESVEELYQAVGQDLGVSNWLEISQTRIHQFAEATGDHQWIHTNPERAKTDSPYKQTVAHGYMTLSLVTMMLGEVFALRSSKLLLNYGLNRVRFPAPVLAGSRVRMHVRLADVAEIDRGVQVTFDCHFENDQQQKPVCVAQTVFRCYLH